MLFLYIAGFLMTLILVTYLGPHGTAQDVFSQSLNLGGYNSMGLSIFIGFITTVFALLDTWYR